MKKFTTINIGVVTCLLFFHCGIKQPMNKIIYTDQNNNIYTITNTKIVYEPIQPNESSSGMYSGGDFKTKSISETNFQEISILVDTLLYAESSHTTKREMLTSILTSFIKGKKKIKIILKPSDERIKFEKKLQEILNK